MLFNAGMVKNKRTGYFESAILCYDKCIFKDKITIWSPVHWNHEVSDQRCQRERPRNGAEYE